MAQLTLVDCMTTSPGEFLSHLLGHSVKVRLSTGTDFKGKLLGMDGSMNVALSGAHDQNSGEHFEKVLLRGNNVLYISACQ